MKRTRTHRGERRAPALRYHTQWRGREAARSKEGAKLRTEYIAQAVNVEGARRVTVNIERIGFGGRAHGRRRVPVVGRCRGGCCQAMEEEKPQGRRKWAPRGKPGTFRRRVYGVASNSIGLVLPTLLRWGQRWGCRHG